GQNRWRPATKPRWLHFPQPPPPARSSAWSTSRSSSAGAIAEPAPAKFSSLTPKESCQCAAWYGASDECTGEKRPRPQWFQHRWLWSNLSSKENHEEEKLQQKAHIKISQAIRSAGQIPPRPPSLLAERRRRAHQLQRRHGRLDLAARRRQGRELPSHRMDAA